MHKNQFKPPKKSRLPSKSILKPCLPVSYKDTSIILATKKFTTKIKY